MINNQNFLLTLFNNKLFFTINFSRFFLFLFLLLAWLKARIIYYVNNWVYTTNHKRIAVNYFWFVILSGICGMVLATAIRMELAYPGVGVFAGDSLQYLSVVTAHGVIMVFFMIMPLLFGAFGNFLLPTQLGVHDVAFPRLNSAAFWFLPGGLLMLCQLVCIDRRYQRMNCFNIREVEALLKKRFFNDLVINTDYRSILDKTLIGVRYKLNNFSFTNHNNFLFSQYGLNLMTQTKSNLFNFNNFTNIVNFNFFYKNIFFLENFFLSINFIGFIYKLIFDIYIYILTIFNWNLPFQQLHFLCMRLLIIIYSIYLYIWAYFYLLWHEMHQSFNALFRFDLIFNSTFLFSVFKSALTRNVVFDMFYLFYYGLDPFVDELVLYIEHNLQIYLTILQNFHDFKIWFYSLLVFYKPYINFNWTFAFLPSFEYLYLLIFSFCKNLFFNFNFFNFNVFNFNFFNFNAFNFNFFNFNFFNSYIYIFCYFFNLINIFNFLNLLIFQLNASIFQILHSYLFINYSNSIYINNSLTYYSNTFDLNSENFLNMYTTFESETNKRFLRFDFPVFKYDYRSGDYFPKLYKLVYPYLWTSMANISSGPRPAAWFFSANFNESFVASVNLILPNIKTFNLNNTNAASATLYNLNKNWLNSNDIFFFFFKSVNDDLFLNFKWISLISLNQKFYNFFLSSSMQQRLYSNWKQLKFTREAWRCKLLVAHHQKTMYKRYIHEDGVFWSIERNAKDLLPGWAMITPFSARTRFTVVGKVDIGLMGVLLVLNASIISSANFLVTYRYLSTLNNRKMRDARAFFTEGVMCASAMMIAANPMLVIGIIMLLSDRHWQTSFFDYSGGGDTVLFQHMFWFFGHPEVYIIMIPAFGFVNTMLSYFLRKRISARTSLIYSMYTIAALGFFVWGHHMYMVGLAHTTRMLFSTLTVMISVPAATKIMHWCVTLVNSTVHFELPLLFTVTFIFFFTSGGISGMCVAHTGMDVLFHDTFYVIAHFHVMLAGSAMFASFGSFYFYFPSIFGVKFSRIFAYFNYIYFFIGQLMTVIPMFWLGYAGMPRRVCDYPAVLGGWHSIVSAGHMLSVAGIISFFIMIFDSIRQAKPAIRNTFGISRYNTRLNFYLYEIGKLYYFQKKTLNLIKPINNKFLFLNNWKYNNYESYETILFSYVFIKK